MTENYDNLNKLWNEISKNNYFNEEMFQFMMKQTIGDLTSAVVLGMTNNILTNI